VVPHATDRRRPRSGNIESIPQRHLLGSELFDFVHVQGLKSLSTHNGREGRRNLGESELREGASISLGGIDYFPAGTVPAAALQVCTRPIK
jgi:hypothetical protein